MPAFEKYSLLQVVVVRERNSHSGVELSYHELLC